MRKYNLGKRFAAFALFWSMFLLPIAVTAQTRVEMPKNKYSVQDDVKIGREATREVEQQLPILNDYETTRYVQSVGQRLVTAIPPQFRQPAFDYDFKVVNASDINAFALPGGPMYVNRGMIQAARSEGEMAGVMAHEVAHIALRHGTSQATKQGNIWTQLGTIGLVLGGAVLGGETGAQLGALGAQAWLTKYSREYERQADILGAQILARAGYDPRDLANMFRTIEQQSGGSRAPEWLSSHPDPGSRYETINREAQMLRVSPSNAIQDTREFQSIQSRLQRMPRAMTMEEIARNQQRTGNTQGQIPTASGRYERNVPYPSSSMQTYSSGEWIRVNYPSNWRVFEDRASVQFAPEGAYGNNGITHGVMIGLAQARTNDLARATQEHVSGLLQANNYLRQQSNFSRTYIGNRQGYATTLAGTSPVTGRTEVVNIYTTQLRNGELFYIATVAPEGEYSRYNNAFRNIIRSLRLND